MAGWWPRKENKGENGEEPLTIKNGKGGGPGASDKPAMTKKHWGNSGPWTSLACNRLLLAGSSVALLAINSVVLSQAVSQSSTVVFSTVYPSASNLAVLVEVAASLLLAVSLLGFLAAFRRSRAMVKLFLLVTLALLIFSIVICVLVSGLGQADSLVVASDQMQSGWKAAVAMATGGNDSTGAYSSFIAGITANGGCCGFDSATDPAQNPPQLKCIVTAKTCSSYLSSYIAQEIDSLVLSYAVLIGIMGADLLMLVLFIVRIVPQPVYREDPGAYYYA